MVKRREIEMRICMVEQDFFMPLEDRIVFDLENYIIIRKILEAEMVESILGGICA